MFDRLSRHGDRQIAAYEGSRDFSELHRLGEVRRGCIGHLQSRRDLTKITQATAHEQDPRLRVRLRETLHAWPPQDGEDF